MSATMAGEKGDLPSASVPRTYASDGAPNGVSSETSRTSVRPGMEYRPLPPMMPISASANHPSVLACKPTIIAGGVGFQVLNFRLQVRTEGTVQRLCVDGAGRVASSVGVSPPCARRRRMSVCAGRSRGGGHSLDPPTLWELAGRMKWRDPSPPRRAKDDSPPFQRWVGVQLRIRVPRGRQSISLTRRVVPCPRHSESSNHSYPAMKQLGFLIPSRRAGLARWRIWLSRQIRGCLICSKRCDVCALTGRGGSHRVWPSRVKTSVASRKQARSRGHGEP